MSQDRSISVNKSVGATPCRQRGQHECFAEWLNEHDASSRTHRAWRQRTAGADTGMNVNTIRRGRRELNDDLAGRPTDRVRKRGGRPALEKKVQL